MSLVYQQLGIQMRKLKHPILYCFNLPTNMFAWYGTKQYNHVLKRFKDLDADAILVPNAVSKGSSIETRGASFMRKIQKLKSERPDSKFHLVGCSFAGVDLRAMISLH